MTSLTCPKCRHGLSDEALDAGACPLCGFPLDGPVVLSAPSGSGLQRLLLPATAAAVTLLAVMGYLLFGRDTPAVSPSAVEVGAAAPSIELPSKPPLPIAPPPREVKPAPWPPVPTDLKPPQPPAPPEPPKPAVRAVGVVMKVDPKITPQRHFDHPDDTAALPDLKTGDRVVLTGRVRVLRLGSVSGKAVLDASGLIAEEVAITGDLGGESQVSVHAPNGTVAVGGYVTGAAKLNVAASGGSVVIAGSGRVASGAIITATAKTLEVKCPISDGARITITFDAVGSLKLSRTEDGASVRYRRAKPDDPDPAIHFGDLRDRATVLEEK
jgi:hypothetical protein